MCAGTSVNWKAYRIRLSRPPGCAPPTASRRRTVISRHGPITVSKHTFHPIWDWKKARLLEEIERAGLKLPVDYLIWGRTFDGIGARFTIPLRETFPDDYALACAYFPHIPADIERMRSEQAQELT